MYVCVPGSHAALNCPGSGMRFDVTFPLIRRERTAGSRLASRFAMLPVLSCTDHELSPDRGPPMPKMS